ncbi:MAG: methionine adenosyltransferase domain-containing protein, partial [Psychrilyobacter sp.]|uniref:methionine adenosyltransferase domain-containing protein n=1 Tax=Psychrilyobacter sp. TaxID=2586924 RepID=UPI003C7417C8
VDTVVVSVQHHPDVTQSEIHKTIIEKVINPTLEKYKLNPKCVKHYHINPTGRFVIGGPHGDVGLTGRKIIVDTYGGYFRHGGGAFSGKDPSKVDRSAAYAARWVAKNIVGADLAEKCEVQLSYAIGVAEPTSIKIDSFGTGKISEIKMANIVKNIFDLTPKGIESDLELRSGNFEYQDLAAFGHIGRTDIDLPWERLNKVDLIKFQLRK